ncbi:MAG: hypothetical protein HQL93_08715 [Magnetococcales bacterium]|nr:hypothetical protein [Magnetococcales bacterium]
MRFPFRITCAGILSIAMGCTPVPPPSVNAEQKAPSAETQVNEETIPGTVKLSPFLPKEGDYKPQARATYTVVVTDVPINEVLFALARDAHLNVDIVPGITGNVTINAIDQTLPRILERIAYQANIRYQIKDNVLSVEPDLPYRHNYRVDYVTSVRNVQSMMKLTPTVSSNESSNNNSNANINSIQMNTASTLDFWKNLISNLNEILGQKSTSIEETDTSAITTPTEQKAPTSPTDTTKIERSKKTEIIPLETKKIIWNAATGVISVLATTKQHKEIEQFIDRVVHSAQRQVLIEATIAEVTLSDQYQSGIDWSLIKRNNDKGLEIKKATSTLNPLTPIGLTLTLEKDRIPFLSDVLGDLKVDATLNMLSQFGSTKVLSSPRITVLNNQTAMLRVATDEVYFNIVPSPPVINPVNGLTIPSQPTTTLKTINIGFIMQVTPQISETDVITLNIRPTIQRFKEWKNDPIYPASKVPVVKVQEMDSVLRIPNGQVAVMGGLMETSRAKESDGIPILSELPIFGTLFSSREQETTKRELVIFLRPILVKEPRSTLNPRDKQFYSDRDTPFPDNWQRDPSAL